MDNRKQMIFREIINGEDMYMNQYTREGYIKLKYLAD